MTLRRRAAPLVACLALAACGSDPAPAPATDRDPVMVAAVEEPLMTDPDLSQSNARNQVAVPGGPGDASLPTLAFAADDAGRAEAEALVLTGARIRQPGLLPSPSPRLAAADARTLVERVRVLVEAGGCADRLGHGFGWSAAVGDALPVYPRAHVLEAAGIADGPCGLRAASFITPVAPQPLMAFYHARARAAGYRDAASVAGDAALLEGAKQVAGARQGPRFAVLLRNVGGGQTVVDLVLRDK